MARDYCCNQDYTHHPPSASMTGTPMLRQLLLRRDLRRAADLIQDKNSTFISAV